MTNKQLLRAEMIANGLSSEDLADELGISRQSFSYKLNNKRPFTSNEISVIAHLLKMSPEKVMQIFFEKQVDE